MSVGIFWCIYGAVYSQKQEKAIEQEKNSVRTQFTGIIDSDYGHFEAWDKLCGKGYPRADFATYPRGRVVYDLKKGEHILYADECVTENEIKEIAGIFKADEYRVCRDEHYACDKCVRKKRLFD